jgi:hypothetical protein
MSVAQGYEKIPTNGLVFMYDVADSTSYKGEPTTNVFTPLGFAGPGSGNDNNVSFDVNGTGTFIRLGFGQTFGNYTIQPNDVVYKYNLGGYGCHYHGNDVAISNGKYATFSFDYYISPDTVNLGVENSLLANFEQALGASITLPNTNLGVWQSVSLTSGPTSGGNLRSLLYPGGCGPRLASSGYILFKNPQVEFLPHKTQFVQTTRSATQALLPLVSNSTIDLTNVSFDANAQMTFDGTNDYITTTASTYGITNEFTIEIVCNPTQVLPTGMFNFLGTVGDRGIMCHWPWVDGNIYFDVHNTSGAFHRWYKTINITNQIALYHIMITPAGEMKVKQNNTVLAPNSANTFSGNVSIGVSHVIGAFSTSANLPWKGDIYAFKVYNRALTDEETLQSYNKYKTRFNLS